MNNKGFTLVELLVMLTVLGILIGITIPNISGILKDNRNTAFLEDASRMYDLTKVKETIKKDIKPTQLNRCNRVLLNDLDTNNDYEESPSGKKYDKTNSFVQIKLISTNNYIYRYTYCIQLVDTEGYGIRLAPLDKINKKEDNLVGNNSDTHSECQC